MRGRKNSDGPVAFAGWVGLILFCAILTNLGLFLGLVAAGITAEVIRRLRIRYTGRGYVDWESIASRKVKKMREEETV